MLRHQNNDWNKLKEILNEINILLPFKEGEIWTVSFGENIGIETNGKGDNFERPGLIVRKFSDNHGWIVPITRVRFPKAGIHFPINHISLDVTSSVILTQLRTIDNQRLLMKIGTLSPLQFKETIKLLKRLF